MGCCKVATSKPDNMNLTTPASHLSTSQFFMRQTFLHFPDQVVAIERYMCFFRISTKVSCNYNNQQYDRHDLMRHSSVDLYDHITATCIY